jgi:hypothetical protein
MSGIDVQALATSDTRNEFSLVSQEAVLFHGTINQNILLVVNVIINDSRLTASPSRPRFTALYPLSQRDTRPKSALEALLFLGAKTTYCHCSSYLTRLKYSAIG